MTGTDAWWRIFEQEDATGQFLRTHGPTLPWRVAAQSTALLAQVLAEYRIQFWAAEEEAGHCEHAAVHLAALARASAGAQPPTVTRPPGPWRVWAWREGAPPAVVAHHPSQEGAEGDAVARGVGGDGHWVWWAEPDPEAPPIAARTRTPDTPGWQPRIDPDVRYAAFAAEEVVATLCLGAAEGATGPDILTTGHLCLLGDAVWRSIHEYRTLLAGAWTDMEACEHAIAHDDRASAALAATDRDRPDMRWRHVTVLGPTAGNKRWEVAQHRRRADAAAAVAVARVSNETAVHWIEPVIPDE